MSRQHRTPVTSRTSRRRALLAVLLGSITLSCSEGTGGELEQGRLPGKPDVVLLTLDTTRYDHLGCYGYERDTSPALDGLAREGVRFEVAYASAPVTLPSHASILTGRHPVHHGVRSNGRYLLRNEAHTLAELFDAAGYQTAAFLSAVVLDRRYGLSQGFDHYGDQFTDRGNGSVQGRRRAAEVVDEALAWLRTRESEDPVFLWLHFFDPHHPWSPREDLIRSFGQGEVDLYDASIRQMDDEIGRLRTELGKLDIDPLWAILSDHGEGLSEHGEDTHGSFAYETTTRIAFILSGAGLPARVSSQVASQVDLVPTLGDLLELELPARLDGVPLVRHLDDETEREAYIEALLGYEEYGWSPVYGLVKERWKYVDAPRPELYDLANDPDEENNLASSEVERVDALRRALERYRGTKREPSTDPSIEPAHLEALQALGYTGGGAMRLRDEELPDPKDMVEVARKLSAAKSLLVVGTGRDPARAFALLEEILQANPANRDALNWLGREAWREAVQNPDAPERSTYIEHSRGAFARMCVRAPELPDGEFGFALLAALEDDVAGAIGHYEAAIQLDPNHIESLENLMRIRHMTNDFPRAVELSEIILRLDAEHHDALQFGGLSHFRLGAYQPAIDLLLQLLPTRDPNEHNGLHFVLGECYRKSDRPKEALAEYAEIREPRRTALGVAALEEECRNALK